MDVCVYSKEKVSCELDLYVLYGAKACEYGEKEQDAMLDATLENPSMFSQGRKG